MTRYTTDNGTVITDAMVERWAEDAEQGFAHSTVTPVTGRPWETCTEPMKPRTVRMPDSLWRRRAASTLESARSCGRHWRTSSNHSPPPVITVTPIAGRPACDVLDIRPADVDSDRAGV